MPQGQTEPRHAHDWSVQARVSRNELDDSGMVVDFHRLKMLLENVIDVLNDSCLNEVDFFGKTNPSAEMVAKYIFERLEPQLPLELKLDSVRVGEQIGCWAKFSK
jgi:6-pyruvoyltetrahydropterin/6-carboxytetrahydropterin synthase